MGESKLQMKHFTALALHLPNNRVGHVYLVHPLTTALHFRYFDSRSFLIEFQIFVLKIAQDKNQLMHS